MKWKYIIPFIVLFSGISDYISAQHLSQSLPIKVNAPEVMTNITSEIKLLENKYNKPPGKTIDKIDFLCSKVFIDSSGLDFNGLLDAGENLAHPGDELAVYSSVTNDYMLEISFIELYFRILNAVQKHLLFLYQNLPSSQKLINIPILATTCLDISQIKTKLVSRQIWNISSSEKKEEKLRGWLAIKRMLDEIDVQKSESGDQVVQRSPYGIISSQGEILRKLTSLSENEEDVSIRTYSSGLIKLIAETPSKYEEYKTEIALSELGLYNSFGVRINQKALSFFNLALGTNKILDKIALYTSAIENDSNFSAAYNNRAMCYYENKNYKAAQEDFLKAIKLDPGYFSAFKYLGNCFYKTGQFNDAAKSFSEALKYEMSDTLFITRGLCYQKSGFYDNAVSDFSSAIKFNSKSISAYINRVQCYLSLKQYDDASKDYQKLIRLEPNNSNHYYNLGCIYSLKKEWNKVVETWEKGLIINPDDKNIKANLPKAKSSLERQKRNKVTKGE